jgi:nucleotide-binding universal stress UspA family protein
MYDRILVPTDGSEAADAALDGAIAVAAATDATLHVLYVADTNQPSLARIEGEVRDVRDGEGADVVEAAADRARRQGVEVVDDVIQGGPSRTILDYVDDRGIDLVVMGTRGQRDLERIVLGSVTGRVLRRSPVPVLAVPPEADALVFPPERVLVGTDGSDAADRAVREAGRIAGVSGGRVTVGTVVETGLLGFDVRSESAAAERREHTEQLVSEAADLATDAGAGSVETAVRDGDTVDELNALADEADADLLVLGTHGRGGIDRRLLGSVTEGVVRAARRPVLSVGGPEA